MAASTGTPPDHTKRQLITTSLRDRLSVGGLDDALVIRPLSLFSVVDAILYPIQYIRKQLFTRRVSLREGKRKRSTRKVGWARRETHYYSCPAGI
jgi:hypothetical protein